MEKDVFTRYFELLKGKGVKINSFAYTAMYQSTVVLPRITHITSMMFGTFPSGWSRSSQTKPNKGCEELAAWIQLISNHLWWSAETCNDSLQLLREKWKSVWDHVFNRHKWSGNTHFHRCCHRHISSSEANKICWLKCL